MSIVKEFSSFKSGSPKDKFSSLIGETNVKYIESNNWVSFEENGGLIEMNFLTKDGKNDTVIFCSVCYDDNKKEWTSQNCIDYPDIPFKSYKEMRDHLIDIEDEIINNGFETVDLP